jgi:predicted transcriptional regulator
MLNIYILDLRTKLRYLGVPVNTKSYMFGNITNSTIPHSSLNKRHNALSYRVREMLAARIMGVLLD